MIIDRKQGIEDSKMELTKLNNQRKKVKNKKNTSISKNQKTARFAILLIIVCTVFTSVGQILLKLSTKNMSLNFFSLITNYYLIFGVIIYGLGALIMLVALKKGELSVLYPFIALSFIWVALISLFFLHEKLLLINWIGIILIVGGVSLIGRGAK